MPIEVIDPNAPPLPPDSHKSSVKLLEKYLEMAKQGQIEEVFLVAIAPDDGVFFQCCQTSSVIRQLGAVRIAEAGILASVGDE